MEKKIIACKCACTVTSGEYNHIDHCVCKKEENYQCILEISFVQHLWTFVKIGGNNTPIHVDFQRIAYC